MVAAAMAAALTEDRAAAATAAAATVAAAVEQEKFCQRLHSLPRSLTLCTCLPRLQLEWTDGAAPIDIALAACSRRALALPSVPSLVRVRRRRRRAQAIAVHAEGRAGAAAAGGRAGGGDRQAGGGRRDTTTSGEGGGALPEVSHSVVRLSVCPSVAHRRRPTATDGDRAIAVALQLAVRTHAGRMCESEPEPRKSPSRLEKISIVGDYSLRVYHLA